MRKYTTPIEQLTVEDIDLSTAQIYVTIKNDRTTLTFTGDRLDVDFDGTDTVINLHLTQEESGSFAVGSVWVQVNWLMDGERNATEVVRLDVQSNLLNKVI